MSLSSHKSTLIVGGARSGKSALAETLCEESGLRLIYVATSPIMDDEEMEARIKVHQDRRGEQWQLIEEPLALEKVLREYGNAADKVLLIDCLTLWLSNCLYHEKDAMVLLCGLEKTIETCRARLVFISNEVGQGIVPNNALSRQFRDQQGWLNQKMAKICDRVIEVRLGIPIQLKPSNNPPVVL